MAFLPERPEDTTQEPAQPTGGVGAGPVSASAPTAKAAPQGSGQWTNLQAYLKANQPQAQQMAGQIQSNLQQAREKAGEQIKQSTEDYGKYIAGEEQTTQEKKDWVDYVTKGDNPATAAIENDWYPGKGGEEVTSPEGLFEQGAAPKAYQAPTYPVQQFQQRLGATRTEAGRMAELQRLQGQRATRGESLLNQMLLQNAPGSREMFAQQRAQNLQPQLEQAQADALARQQALQQLQQATPGYLGEQLYGAGQDVGQQISDVEAQNQLAQDYQANLAAWERNYNQGYQDSMIRSSNRGWSREKREAIAERDALLRAGEKPVDPGFEIMPTEDLMARQAALQQLLEQSGYVPPEGV